MKKEEKKEIEEKKEEQVHFELIANDDKSTGTRGVGNGGEIQYACAASNFITIFATRKGTMIDDFENGSALVQSMDKVF